MVAAAGIRLGVITSAAFSLLVRVRFTVDDVIVLRGSFRSEGQRGDTRQQRYRGIAAVAGGGFLGLDELCAFLFQRCCSLLQLLIESLCGGELILVVLFEEVVVQYLGDRGAIVGRFRIDEIDSDCVLFVLRIRMPGCSCDG